MDVRNHNFSICDFIYARYNGTGCVHLEFTTISGNNHSGDNHSGDNHSGDNHSGDNHGEIDSEMENPIPKYGFSHAA